MSLNRDSNGFLSVIEANKGIIYKVANTYCSNDENRKDLIQEIILQLWQSFSKYEERYKITTWMYRIALNVSISFYRKENQKIKLLLPLPAEIIFLQPEKTAVEQEANIRLLYTFIKELKELDRAIILLYLEDNSQQDIASILGLTATNVSTRVARIKLQLKQKFSTLQT